MYESPITEILTPVMYEYENECIRAVQRVGFDVNKEELIKALQYDRNQYNKGYADAIEEFAEKLIAHFNDWCCQEAPCNDDETDRTRHIICDTICDAIGGVNEIAESMKGEKE